jgi:molecular chaperone GrpE
MPHRVEDEGIATEAVDVGTLVAENASLRDRLLRALADAENTRRRAERSIEESRKHAIAAFAREMLIVVDNLQRTIAAAEDQGPATTESAAALIEGVRATLRVLMRILESFDVRPIAALGERFDPSIHEAIMEEDDPSRPPGTVTRVVEDGYMISDRLLRPARVVVSKRAAPEEEEANIYDAN